MGNRQKALVEIRNIRVCKLRIAPGLYRLSLTLKVLQLLPSASCLLALYYRHHLFGEQAHRLLYFFMRNAAEVKSRRQCIEVVVSPRIVKDIDALHRIAVKIAAGGEHRFPVVIGRRNGQRLAANPGNFVVTGNRRAADLVRPN